MKKTIALFALVLLLGVFPGVSYAGEVTMFEKQYLRTEGDPNLYTGPFTGVEGEGKLIVKNGDYDGEGRVDDEIVEVNGKLLVSSAKVFVNGEQVFGPSDFNKNVYYLEAIINISTSNSISVELRSKPGSYIIVQVVQYDNEPPVPNIDPLLSKTGECSASITDTPTATDVFAGQVTGTPSDSLTYTDQGTFTVIWTYYDGNGNSSTQTQTVVVDDITAPIPDVDPLPDIEGKGNASVSTFPTATDNCIGTVAGTTTDSMYYSIPGEYTITWTYDDGHENISTQQQILKVIEAVPPTLSLTYPPNEAQINTGTPNITVTFSDDESGIDQNSFSATLDSADISALFTVTDSGASYQVPDSSPLADGDHTLEVSISDNAGNITTQSSQFEYLKAPIVTITSPENLITVGSSPITVAGTVDDPNVILTINGVEVPVNPDGTYSVEGIVLNEGGNTIVASAVNTANNVGTANIHVYFDSTAPYVTITYPEDGYTTTSSPITVTGSIVDVVKGEVNEENASVSVNGTPAPVSNKTFIAEDIPLVEGENTITAVGADQTGNTKTTSVTVYLDLSALKKIDMVSGNNQAGPINTTLPNPLVVSLTNANGSPAAGKTVIFEIIQNNGILTGDSGEAASLAETTDENGNAQVNLKLGSTAGVGNNKVEVSAVGFTGKVVFTASGLVSSAHKINIATGNNQKGAVNTPLPKPLIAIVTDEGHNPVKDVPVTFTVVKGGGSFDGQPSITVNSDSDGRATANLTLGSVGGLDNNSVEANFEGNQTAAAIFRASGLTIGDPGDTKISGVVLDNMNIPIPGVTMRVEGTTREGVTDEQGQFLIANVPVGPLHLIADGSTATVPGEYPTLAFEIDTVAGQNNSLPMPIYLLPLNTTNTQWVGGDEDVVYTLDSIPGFSLKIKANSVTFPDGSHEGYISVTQVHADKVPMTPPNGFQPRFIITIQPPGAVFDPPAPITIPNVDGLAPNEITEMYSFDHDLGQFVSIGTGTISKDGQVIKSDPGVGVIKAGWHCGGDPQPEGKTERLKMKSISIKPPGPPYLCIEDQMCFTGTANAPGVEWQVSGGNYNEISKTDNGNSSTICLKFNDAAVYMVKAICEKGSPLSKSVKVTAIEVESLLPNEGTEIDDKDGDQDTKTFIVPASDSGEIIVTAVPHPNVSESNLPPCWTLTGGSGTGKLKRTISKAMAGSFILTATSGTSSKSIKIIVVDVEIKAKNETGNPQYDYSLCVGEQKDYIAIVSPQVSGTFKWSWVGVSNKITGIICEECQTVTVIAGHEPSENGVTDDLKVEFTPTEISIIPKPSDKISLTVVDISYLVERKIVLEEEIEILKELIKKDELELVKIEAEITLKNKELEKQEDFLKKKEIELEDQRKVIDILEKAYEESKKFDTPLKILLFVYSSGKLTVNYVIGTFTIMSIAEDVAGVFIDKLTSPSFWADLVMRISEDINTQQTKYIQIDLELQVLRYEVILLNKEIELLISRHVKLVISIPKSKKELEMKKKELEEVEKKIANCW